MIDCRIVKDVLYATQGERELYLDLYLPLNAAGPLPMVMWIPGGGWRNSVRAGGRTAFLVDHGFATACIEYRVSGEAAAPANVHDCKAAVRWLRAHAEAYGIDPDRIGVWGSSAGGHLAALLCLTNGHPELEGAGSTDGVSSNVAAACDFCGPSDLGRMANPDMAASHAVLREVTDQYLGGPVDKRMDLARLVSPLTHVSAGAPPMLIGHGETDPTVPLIESQDLHDALKQAGCDVTLHVVKGGGHGWEWSLTNDIVIAFFRRVLTR